MTQAIPLPVQLGDPALSREIAVEVERIVAGLPADASCLLTGSLIEGLGNANSDIDVYVVHAGTGATSAIALGMRASRYVDCEYMTTRSLLELLRKLQETDWRTLAELPRSAVDRFYRLAVAAPVVVAPQTAEVLAGFTRGAACRATQDWARLTAYRAMARGALALALDERRQAGVLLRQAAVWQATSRLAGEGEGYPAAKWLPEKAARRHGAGSAAYHDLVDDVLRPGPSAADLLDRLRAGVHAPAGLVEAVRGEPLALAGDVRQVTVDSGDHLVRGRKTMAAVGRTMGAVLRDVAGGRPWPEAVAAAAAPLGLPADELRTALWHQSAPLRTAGFLHAS